LSPLLSRYGSALMLVSLIIAKLREGNGVGRMIASAGVAEGEG